MVPGCPQTSPRESGEGGEFRKLMGPKHRTSNIQSGSSPPRAKPLGGKEALGKAEIGKAESRNTRASGGRHTGDSPETHRRHTGDNFGRQKEE